MSATAVKLAPLPDLFDDEGFILDFPTWSNALAETTAQEYRLGKLSAAHWQIIQAMREHFTMNHSVAPAMYRVCRDAGIERHQVNELFGNCLVAWRVAGLPNPGEEAKTYLNNM